MLIAILRSDSYPWQSAKSVVKLLARTDDTDLNRIAFGDILLASDLHLE